MTRNWSEMTIREQVDYLLNQLQIKTDKIEHLEARVSELEKNRKG